MNAYSQLLSYLGGSPADRTVLKTVVAGADSRAQIAEATGFDPATVTRSVSRLLSHKILLEGTAEANGGLVGRPRRTLLTNDEYFWVAGLHIGLRGVNAAAVGLRGETGDISSAPHDGSRESIIKAAERCVHDLFASHSHPPLGVGVAVAGFVDSEAGEILEMPGSDWEGLDLAEALASEFDSPTRVMPMGRAQALSNVLYGVVKPEDSFGHLYVGYIVEYVGAIRGTAWPTEPGHDGAIEHLMLRTKDGAASVHDLISDSALVLQAEQRGLLGPDGDFEELLEMSESPGTPGAIEARDLLEQRARYVGRLIVQLQEIVPLPTMVLSASIVRQPDGLQVVKDVVQSECRNRTNPRILSAGEVRTANPRAGAAVFYGSLLLENEG